MANPTASNNNETLTRIQDNIDELYNAIYKGNGVPSLLQQISDVKAQVKILENTISTQLNSIETSVNLKIESFEAVLEGKFEGISKQLNEEFAKRENNKINWWNHKTVVATTVITCAASIVTLILSKLFQ